MPGRVVYKYPLLLSDQPQVLVLPVDARVVHVHAQDDVPTLWAEVDPDRPSSHARTFIVAATGRPIPPLFTNYLGTVHLGWTVWHVYERVFRP